MYFCRSYIDHWIATRKLYLEISYDNSPNIDSEMISRSSHTHKHTDVSDETWGDITFLIWLDIFILRWKLMSHTQCIMISATASRCLAQLTQLFNHWSRKHNIFTCSSDALAVYIDRYGLCNRIYRTVHKGLKVAFFKALSNWKEHYRTTFQFRKNVMHCRQLKGHNLLGKCKLNSAAQKNDN